MDNTEKRATLFTQDTGQRQKKKTATQKTKTMNNTDLTNNRCEPRRRSSSFCF